jgi:hypothetical protein
MWTIMKIMIDVLFSSFLSGLSWPRASGIQFTSGSGFPHGGGWIIDPLRHRLFHEPRDWRMSDPVHIIFSSPINRITTTLVRLSRGCARIPRCLFRHRDDLGPAWPR